MANKNLRAGCVYTSKDEKLANQVKNAVYESSEKISWNDLATLHDTEKGEWQVWVSRATATELKQLISFAKGVQVGWSRCKFFTEHGLG